MNNKKYQIFISSTYEDLKEEREKVRDAILSMNHFPVGMEFFGATSDSQWKIIQDTIDTSDYYVLIIAKRYGSLLPDDDEYAGVSYTEREYRYAKSQNVPILAFVMDKSVPRTDEQREQNNNSVKKLEKFIGEVTSKRTVVFWKNSDDLVKNVISSLYKEMSSNPRIGWIRGDDKEFISSGNTSNIILENSLKSIVHNRVPQFKCCFDIDEKNDNNNPLYNNYVNGYYDSDGILTIKLKKIKYDIPRKYCTKLLKSDISLAKAEYGHKFSVSTKELDEYNASLPSKEELEKFKEEMIEYKNIMECGIPLDILIKNIGNKKGTDINISIDIPLGLKIYNINISKNIKPPIIKMPPNPITAEMNRLKKLQQKWYFSNEDFNIPSLEVCKISNVIDNSYLNEITNSYKFYILNDNSGVRIKIKELLHTKSSYIDGLYLVPSREGDFQIKCETICEEMENIQEEIVNVIVK